MADREAESQSRVDRKLKHIEQEKKRVQSEINALSRALRRGDVLSSPAAPGAMQASHNLPSGASGGGRALPARGDQRFAHYFSTGGFKSPIPGRQERRIQRNKAIFALILLVVVGYIVLTLIRL
jgi:hypothetical protein